MFSNGGIFFSNGGRKNFGKGYSLEGGTKIGLLIDMFKGTIQIFIDDKNQGEAITNQAELKTDVFYITLNSNGFEGTVTLVPQTSQLQPQSHQLVIKGVDYSALLSLLNIKINATND